MATKIILSTKNPSKAEQITQVLSGLSVEILTLDEVGIKGEAIENGQTLEENAFKKARFAKQDGKWSMADDTGLFIDALDGKPGIHAARWAGEQASTEEIMLFTLGKLRNIPDKLRTATFKTVAVLISPDGQEYIFSGEVEGKIMTEPRTNPQPKMPYSPLFMPNGHNKTWAEMTVEEENLVSHRGKAFGKVRKFLVDVLEGAV